MTDANDFDDRQAGDWMRQLASQPIESRLLDPQVIWWKSQALRRIDRERETEAAFERVERMQLVVSISAALLLLLSLVFIVPESISPLFFLTVAGSIIATAIALRSLWPSDGVRKSV